MQTQWEQSSLDKVRTLRDEIRVDLHLAKMDAKDRWAALEKRILEAERHAKAKIVGELVQDLQHFKKALKG